MASAIVAKGVGMRYPMIFGRSTLGLQQRWGTRCRRKSLSDDDRG